MVTQRSFKVTLLIASSFIVAMMLSILPLPGWALWLRPEWISLVLIYWMISLPQRVSLFAVWLVGLLVDVLYGSTFGEHALALTLLCFLVARMHLQIRVYPMWQQACGIFILVGIHQLVIILLHAVLYSSAHLSFYLLPCVTSMLLWPWLFVVMRNTQRRFGIYQS